MTRFVLVQGPRPTICTIKSLDSQGGFSNHLKARLGIFPEVNGSVDPQGIMALTEVILELGILRKSKRGFQQGSKERGLCAHKKGGMNALLCEG